MMTIHEYPAFDSGDMGWHTYVYDTSLCKTEFSQSDKLTIMCKGNRPKLLTAEERVLLNVSYTAWNQNCKHTCLLEAVLWNDGQAFVETYVLKVSTTTECLFPEFLESFWSIELPDSGVFESSHGYSFQGHWKIYSLKIFTTLKSGLSNRS